jgi:hypothetical protein
MAVGVVDEAIAMGIHVPEDLSIVGFDDAIIAESVRPALTTVRQPLAELGSAAFALFRKGLDTRARIPDETLLEPLLVVRLSTAPPNSAVHGGGGSASTPGAAPPPCGADETAAPASRRTTNQLRSERKSR